MPQDVNPLIDRLCAAFPDLFHRRTPKPLKIGLGAELMALAGVHPALADLTRTRIRWALKVYTGAAAYRSALAKGGPRYDLAGQPAGEVTPEQQAFAQSPRARKPATAAAESTASPTRAAAPAGIPLHELLPELIAMAIPGKLDVTLKINTLPQAKPASPGTMLFAVQAEGCTVLVELKNKMWNSLKTAAESYPHWVAAITGKMGAAIEGGFRLDSPAVQVFEKKVKPDATAPAASKAPVPVSTGPEPEPAPRIERPKLGLKGSATPGKSA
ncbi:putative Fertility inhibition FinO-like protein [Candidatus Competibacter denitrificans Run_A_D11]|uniref:Fertility inhibition FinO-like protein n=1 Tax=Candidatus Competibacter denitrificans Run_A_D11 TaxID=1400863 RepID=W6M9F1_9GAMM|nr:ProQ/FinO family protein [Candidatus Competibacter denitrificans]CDI04636.1 putative Fertility inhibition FinO-like protein [Candidatus Competibacter denitrificans Run_A_D11]